VDAGNMTVRLDAGRSVAFDLKDYAHLDHGYAATIHKAQGMTVDRAHVLATPGLDRHAAYVALSRHRDSVQLHYGRDDFADDAMLARGLSRDRSKDMASDYERDSAAPGRLRTEPLRTTSERQPEPERRNEPGIFASFRPITVSPDGYGPGDRAQSPRLSGSWARARFGHLRRAEWPKRRSRFNPKPTKIPPRSPSRRCARKSPSSAARSLGSRRSGRQSTFLTTAKRWDTSCAPLQRRHKL
jgi:hypothetical protein